jgi:hypothetical protein
MKAARDQVRWRIANAISSAIHTVYDVHWGLELITASMASMANARFLPLGGNLLTITGDRRISRRSAGIASLPTISSGCPHKLNRAQISLQICILTTVWQAVWHALA